MAIITPVLFGLRNLKSLKSQASFQLIFNFFFSISFFLLRYTPFVCKLRCFGGFDFFGDQKVFLIWMFTAKNLQWLIFYYNLCQRLIVRICTLWTWMTQKCCYFLRNHTKLENQNPLLHCPQPNATPANSTGENAKLPWSSSSSSASKTETLYPGSSPPDEL